MQVSVQLPKAFSIRQEGELTLIQDLMTRLNPKLMVAQVATGVHLHDGATVTWGLVYLEGQDPPVKEVQAALAEAGLDQQHNAEIQEPRIWVNNQPNLLVETPA